MEFLDPKSPNGPSLRTNHCRPRLDRSSTPRRPFDLVPPARPVTSLLRKPVPYLSLSDYRPPPLDQSRLTHSPYHTHTEVSPQRSASAQVPLADPALYSQHHTILSPRGHMQPPSHIKLPPSSETDPSFRTPSPQNSICTSLCGPIQLEQSRLHLISPHACLPQSEKSRNAFSHHRQLTQSTSPHARPSPPYDPYLSPDQQWSTPHTPPTLGVEHRHLSDSPKKHNMVASFQEHHTSPSVRYTPPGPSRPTLYGSPPHPRLPDITASIPANSSNPVDLIPSHSTPCSSTDVPNPPSANDQPVLSPSESAIHDGSTPTASDLESQLCRGITDALDCAFHSLSAIECAQLLYASLDAVLQRYHVAVNADHLPSGQRIPSHVSDVLDLIYLICQGNHAIVQAAFQQAAHEALDQLTGPTTTIPHLLGQLIPAFADCFITAIQTSESPFLLPPTLINHIAAALPGKTPRPLPTSPSLLLASCPTDGASALVPAVSFPPPPAQVDHTSQLNASPSLSPHIPRNVPLSATPPHPTSVRGTAIPSESKVRDFSFHYTPDLTASDSTKTTPSSLPPSGGPLTSPPPGTPLLLHDVQPTPWLSQFSTKAYYNEELKSLHGRTIVLWGTGTYPKELAAEFPPDPCAEGRKDWPDRPT
ncbi:hypothetical protein DACRYDRAFT_112997, partial [Dacryopinax primogenitus]